MQSTAAVKRRIPVVLDGMPDDVSTSGISVEFNDALSAQLQ